MRHKKEETYHRFFLFCFFISAEQIFIYHTQIFVLKKFSFFWLSAEHPVITDKVTKSYCLKKPTWKLKVNTLNIEFILNYQVSDFIKWQKAKQDVDVKSYNIYIFRRIITENTLSCFFEVRLNCLFILVLRTYKRLQHSFQKMPIYHSIIGRIQWFKATQNFIFIMISSSSSSFSAQIKCCLMPSTLFMHLTFISLPSCSWKSEQYCYNKTYIFKKLKSCH